MRVDTNNREIIGGILVLIAIFALLSFDFGFVIVPSGTTVTAGSVQCDEERITINYELNHGGGVHYYDLQKNVECPLSTDTLDEVPSNYPHLLEHNGDGELFVGAGETRPFVIKLQAASGTYSGSILMSTTPPECTEDITKTCDDGSEIITQQCINGELSDTVNTCPQIDKGNPLLLIGILGIVFVALLAVALWLFIKR